MSRNRRRKRKQAVMANSQRGKIPALVQGDVAACCRQRGRELRRHQFTSCHRRLPSDHWQFVSGAGEVLVDYWPRSFTWYSPRTREKGKLQDPYEVIEI